MTINTNIHNDDKDISVFVVDDHNLIRQGLILLLSKLPGIRVVGEAADGLVAVTTAKRLKPDIILMDISMPKLNGIDAMDLICSDTPGSLIIALSMHKEKRFINGAIQAGARGYLLKNSLTDELPMAINAVYSGGYYLSPQIANVVINSFLGKQETGAARGPGQGLTRREREILQLLAEGNTTAEIGSELHISAKTVETHRRNIMEKLGYKKPIDLIKYALREGIIQYDNWLHQ